VANETGELVCIASAFKHQMPCGWDVDLLSCCDGRIALASWQLFQQHVELLCCT
jgi:hypothetical protein